MTCGGGVQNRSRTCTNPPAQFGGKLCPGESDETRVCNEDSCPSKFLLCFDALMLGIGYFNRPVTIWSFSISLSVVPVETECLVSLVIGLTGSDCPVTCGGEVQNRTRNCNNPLAQFGGKPCPGEGDETRSCNEAPYPCKPFLLKITNSSRGLRVCFHFNLSLLG